MEELTFAAFDGSVAPILEIVALIEGKDGLESHLNCKSFD